MRIDRLLIRSEAPSDFPEIRSVHDMAFGRPAEGSLVDALRENQDLLSNSAVWGCIKYREYTTASCPLDESAKNLPIGRSHT
jgi:hypothetical protein